MLLLLTILLVLVAAITLVIGIFSDQLALIWVSIAASFAAAVVLAVVSQTSKRRAQADAAAAPTTSAEPAGAARAGEPATTAVADVPPGEPTAVVPAVAGGGGFPIDDYDSLKVTEIIPKLESLSLDELEMVAIYEEDNKNRTTVLSRIDDLMDELEGVSPAAEAPAAAAPVAATAPASAGALPIADYDDLNVSDILPKLDDLDADELEQVAVYEESNKDRVTILNAIDDRLDVLEGVVAEPAPAPAKKAAAKKAPAKKAAKKSAAKKAPAKKAAKKSAAKKSTAKKSAKKSTAKKSAAKKTTAKKTAKKSTKKR